MYKALSSMHRSANKGVPVILVCTGCACHVVLWGQLGMGISLGGDHKGRSWGLASLNLGSRDGLFR